MNGDERERAWIMVSGSEPLPLASLHFVERVSAPSEGSARLVKGAARWPEEWVPPMAATLRIASRDCERRIAVVVRAIARAFGEDSLELACATLPLALRASPRRFRDVSVREIVDAVLAAVEMRAVWKLAEEPPQLPYVVQSGETDLAFATRVLAAQGAYFFVDDDGALAICDSSPDAPLACTMPLLTSEEALAREPGVRELFVGARVAAGRATVADYDWKRPLLALRESRDADRDTDLEHYIWPAGFYDQNAGERLALKRLQAIRAHADYAEGRSNVPELGPGRCFAVTDEDEWFAVEVEHRFSAEHGYENRFVATPRAHAYRPPVERAPAVGGLESAMACGPAGADIHTDAHGRFKAEMPWDADAQQTDEGARWVRLMQECSTSMFLARSGWEMLLAYVDGDPARPIGVARAMHAGMPPSYAQPTFQGAMTVRTRSSPQDSGGGSELCISDDAGGQRIELVAQRDVATLVKHDQSVTIGRDATEKVGGERTLVVRGDRTIDIGGDLARHIHGDLQEAVTGSMTRKVAAGESVSVKRAHKETIGGADSERVSVLRLTLDGGVGSPADIVKNLVPPPRAALAGVLAASTQELTGGVSRIVGAASAPMDVVTGAVGTAGGAVAAGGAVLGSATLENVQGLKSSAEALAALPDRIGDLKNAVTGLTQLPGMIGGVPGAIASFDVGDAFKSARDRLSGTLKGVLGDLPMLAGALAVGEISKKAAGRYCRRVGGVFVSVSVGDISERALYAHAEMVGGVRLKLTPRTVATSVGGPLTLLVGGTLLRASRSISIKSLQASITAGALFRLKSDGPLTIRGDDIVFRSKSSLRMFVDKTAIDMSSEALAIKGDVLTDSPVVEISGENVNVTKG